MKRFKLFTEKTVTAFLIALITGLILFSFVHNKPPSLPPQADPSRPAFQKETLNILKKDGTALPYEVEMAVTPEQHQHGLMFTTRLPRGHGMIFLYDPPEEAAFWMKNTPIPLDMLFVAEDGKIIKIIPNAKPYDLTPISSETPIRAVLEIGGGEAAGLGIEVGDQMLFDKVKKN